MPAGVPLAQFMSFLALSVFYTSIVVSVGGLPAQPNALAAHQLCCESHNKKIPLNFTL